MISDVKDEDKMILNLFSVTQCVGSKTCGDGFSFFY